MTSLPIVSGNVYDVKPYTQEINMKKIALKIVKSQKGLPKDLTNKAVEPIVTGEKAVPAKVDKVAKPRDNRIPPVGTIITKNYKGETLEVKVL